MAIATAHLQPLGPWSLPQASDVLVHWDPVRRFGSESSEAISVGFLSDQDYRPVAVRIRQPDPAKPLELEVAGACDPRSLAAAIAQTARMFFLDVDGRDYESVGDRDPALQPLLEHFPGLRPVLFASPYEAAIWAVLSARVSMAAAARLQEQLISGWGSSAGEADLRIATLPPPSALRQVVAGSGLTQLKVDRLHAVADAAESGVLDVDELRALGQEEACERLQTVPGIGPFWSLGIYVRACGIPDVFPDEPLAFAALGRLHGLGDDPAPAEVARLTAVYSPFRSWVCFLLRVAAARGLIEGVQGREMAIRRASGGRKRQPAPSGG